MEKIIINKDYRKRNIEFYWVRRNGDKEEFIHPDKTGDLCITQKNIETPIDDDVEVKPFIILPMDMGESFIKLMVNVAKDENLQIGDENLLKGKLEATQKHLDDMREITMLLLKTEQ